MFAWLCGVLAAFLANTMQHRVAPCYNTLLCKQTIKRAVVQNSRPVIIFCWLLKQAVGNHAPTHRGFTSAHSYGRITLRVTLPSPEVSLLPYQYGILIARFFTTRLALAFRLIASFSFANSRPQSPYDYIISRRVFANYRNFCNRKSSHHTDTVFCACSLNCQRTVSVREALFQGLSLN